MTPGAPLQTAAPAEPAKSSTRFESLVAGIATASSAVAATALLIMVLALVADVAMANLFKHPINGTFDFVESTLVVMVFMGFPATFLRGGHIAVDVIDHFVSPATTARLKYLAVVVSLLFVLFFAWQMVTPALDAFKFGERKQELGLPLWALWIPMILGFVLSAVALVAVVFSAAKPRKEE
jgi:TRAP-type C4-dicarboxylate transport system permease small subunit